jgi:hypothetical protein
LTLLELISSFAGRTAREEEVVYVAAPWSCEAVAIVVDLAPDTTQALNIDGVRFEYFLEFFIALEFIEDYVKSCSVAPSRRQMCERLIQYAINDA